PLDRAGDCPGPQRLSDRTTRSARRTPRRSRLPELSLRTQRGREVDRWRTPPPPFGACRARLADAPARGLRRRLARASCDAARHSTRERSARLLPLHALERRAEVRRPQQQRRAPQGDCAAARSKQFAVRGGPARLPAPAPERRPANPGRATAVVERRPEIRPVHALAWRAELARPDPLP